MTSSTQARYFRPTTRKVAMALSLASLIGGMSISPALAEGDNGHGRSDPDGDRGGQREWHGNRPGHGYQAGYQPEYRPEYRPQHVQHYHYAQPVFVPPPVYYEPRQSPGISFFFPLDLRP